MASSTYLFWWLWQLFRLTKREAFPRARAFWWIFVPIYGWILIWRQFDDLDRSARDLGRPGLAANMAILLLVASNAAGVVSNRVAAPAAAAVTFLVGAGFFSLAGYYVQSASNDYLRTKYPDAHPRGMTWGEITATAIGGVVFASAILSPLLVTAYQ